jgi:hypothetical protein
MPATLIRRSLLVVSLLLLPATPIAAAAQYGFTVGKSYTDVVTTGDCYPTTVGGFCGFSHADRESFVLGVTYQQALNPWTSVQPELLLARKGWDNASQPTLSTTYLQLPVLLRIAAQPRGAAIRPVLVAGATANLLVTCSYSSGPACGDRDATRDHRVERLDAGAVVGLGLEVALGSLAYTVEGRFERGLRDVLPGEGGFNRNTSLYVTLSVSPRH